MKQNTKDWIQYGSAMAMLLSAIVLAAVSFWCLQVIHSSVLTYVGEAIAFAAGVYGIGMYVQHEVRKQLRKLQEGGRLDRTDMPEGLSEYLPEKGGVDEAEA